MGTRRRRTVTDANLDQWWAELGSLTADPQNRPVPTLKSFLMASWSEVLHPAETLAMGWYMDLFCEWLTVASVSTAIAFNDTETADRLLAPFGLTAETLDPDLRAVRRLLFNISPRCAKSTTITVCWPCWEWLVMPWLTYMCLSYDQALATDHSDDRRTIIQSPWYQELSGGMALSGSKNRVTEFRNGAMGQMVARGYNAGVTGGGGLRIINDDPNDPNKIDSPAVRQKTLKSFRNYSVSRQNDALRACVVVVQQRTGEEDVSGFIRSNEPDYITVVIPMEAEQDETIVFPLSGRIVERTAGDLMHPQRFDMKVVEALKRDPDVWAAQYQQRPNPAGGGMFKITDWRIAIAPPPAIRKIISVDAAFKNNSTSDFVVVGVVNQLGPVRTVMTPGPIDERTGQPTMEAISEYQYFIEARWRDQADIDQTKDAITAMVRRYPEAYTKLIEDKANGPAIITQLQKSMPGIVPYNPGNDSKTARAAAVIPIHRRHDIILPASPEVAPVLIDKGLDSITLGEWWELHPPPQQFNAEYAPVPEWCKSFIDEHTVFPSGKKDDQVDMMAQAINWMEGNSQAISTGPMEFSSAEI